MIRAKSRSKPAGPQNYETPPALFQKLNSEFKFNIDLAATDGNSLCDQFFSPEEDALSRPWKNFRGFLNPPFKGTRFFLRKAVVEKNSTVVALVLASLDTRWWYDSVIGRASEVRFILGRVEFLLNGEVPRVGPKNKKSSLRAAACIIIYRGGVRSCQTKITWGYSWPDRSRVENWGL